ncbi:MAG TPA: hypothetical protein VGS20_04940 [Candidatus Acidoferrales bacterium]|nr:hypothetical protein [Candidatus Acidoferrales bacterium]
MRKSRWVVNVLLLAGAVGLAWKLRADWRADFRQDGPQAVRARPLALAAAPPALAPRDYTVIGQQNPFSVDRNDVIAAPPQAAALGPPPLYYGSIIFGKQRFALLGSEASPKPQRTAEGDTFNGYKLVNVRPESVVFQTQSGTSEVMLYNAISRLHRDYAKTQPSPAAAASAAAQPTAGTAAAATAGLTVVSGQTQAQSAAQAPPEAGHAGMHAVQTPFGPMWVQDQPHH